MTLTRFSDSLAYFVVVVPLSTHPLEHQPLKSRTLSPHHCAYSPWAQDHPFKLQLSVGLGSCGSHFFLGETVDIICHSRTAFEPTKNAPFPVTILTPCFIVLMAALLSGMGLLACWLLLSLSVQMKTLGEYKPHVLYPPLFPQHLEYNAY